MADAERVDETVHADAAPRVDRGDEVLDQLAVGLLVLLALLDLAFAFLRAALGAELGAAFGKRAVQRIRLLRQAEDVGRAP